MKEPQIHISKWGTYHPNPTYEEVSWTISEVTEEPIECDTCETPINEGFLCLDGGDWLCMECGEIEGLSVGPCDCK